MTNDLTRIGRIVAVAGAVGFFSGNLPDGFEDWMLWAAAAAVVLLLVVVPFARWYAHTYTITTRRVIEQSGLFGRHRTEVGHARGLQLKNREPVSDRDIKSMYSYFARHAVDKRGKYWGMKDKPSARYIAWLLWGGDPGKEWIDDLRDKLREAE